MKLLAIIPARGGSVGVPRKNLALLGGRALIDYTLEAVLGCPAIERHLVSTDDEAIASHCRAFGAQVPFLRPAHLATSSARMLEVVRHALEFTLQTGWVPEAVLLAQPTSPLRTAEHLRQAVALFQSGSFDSLVSVRAVPHNCIPECIYTQDGPLLKPYTTATVPLDRHTKPRYYARNGPAILITRTEVLAQGTFYGQALAPFPMDGAASIDIDAPEDLDLAEFYLQRRLHRPNGPGEAAGAPAAGRSPLAP